MKPTPIAVIAIAVLGLCTASPLLAQGGMRGPASGGRMYDPKTVESVGGLVVKVERIGGKGSGQGKGGRGGGYGLHLVLKTDKEEIPVHLGPVWYVEKHGLKIEPKDTIEVRGSRITYQGKPTIIAAEVKKGDQTLKLRDDNGVPAWRGSGRP